MFLIRLRIASGDAISCLLTYGADPNALAADIDSTRSHSDAVAGGDNTATINFSISSLSLVLSAATALQSDISSSGNVLRQNFNSDLRDPTDSHNKPDESNTGARRGAYRVWVQTAGILLRAGNLSNEMLIFYN